MQRLEAEITDLKEQVQVLEQFRTNQKSQVNDLEKDFLATMMAMKKLSKEKEAIQSDFAKCQSSCVSWSQRYTEEKESRIAMIQSIEKELKEVCKFSYHSMSFVFNA